MAHKFKIGTVVHHNVGKKTIRVLGKKYTIVAFMPEIQGESAYQIKDVDGEMRVATESKLRQGY
jgi:hypothetical protein